MIVLAAQLSAAGSTATAHYSHAPRSVVMQAALSTRLDFTEIDPARLLRASAFFRSWVAGGTTVARPRAIVTATQLTEVHVELIADNCIASAVVSQFDTTGSAVGEPEEAVEVRMVSFLRPQNGTTAYSHTVTVFPGGRPVGEEEAVERATANAGSFGVDLTELRMTVTSDARAVDELLDRDPRDVSL